MVHYRGNLLIKDGDRYEYEGGHIAYFDDFESNFLNLKVFDILGKELELAHPCTTFFSNLRSNQLEMINGNIGEIRLLEFGIRKENVCTIYIQDATPIAYNDLMGFLKRGESHQPK